CVILGYWSDGSVHLRWPAIAGHYRVDGRFPAWVAQVDPTATLAGGGRVLVANNPRVSGPGLSGRVIAVAVLLLVVLVLLVVPASREALGALAGELLQSQH